MAVSSTSGVYLKFTDANAENLEAIERTECAEEAMTDECSRFEKREDQMWMAAAKLRNVSEQGYRELQEISLFLGKI